MPFAKCGCLVCRLEATLAGELGRGSHHSAFEDLGSTCAALSRFPTALALVHQLHSQQELALNSSFSDQIFLELLGLANGDASSEVVRKLLLMSFIPSLHRTVTQIAVTFPSLARDDTAQHLFAVLLEFLSSKELLARRSHIAFTVARKLRRSAFRWAIRESKHSLHKDDPGSADMSLESDPTDQGHHAAVLLHQFLDSCQRRGWLSLEERQLLTQFKLEQMSGREIAQRTGHSSVAIRHRVQRLVARLRRIAQTSGTGPAEQLDLFSSRGKTEAR